MGVAIAMAGIGIAGGVMGQMGQQQQAKAQYMANKIEVDRNNFQNALANDRKNFAAARANALRAWNNKKIGEAAVANYADQRRANRMTWQANAHNLAKSQMMMTASLDSLSTGRGMRGGTADAIQREADMKFSQERLNLAKQRWAADTGAKATYQAELNKRDLLSYESANIYMPGSSGVAPGSNNMGMLAAALGGGAQGAAQGMSMMESFQSLKQGGASGGLFGIF